VVLNCVNLATRTPAKWQLIVRHFDRVGVLACVMDQIRRANTNIEEVQNIIFDGATAACCRIQLDTEPGDKLLAAIKERQPRHHQRRVAQNRGLTAPSSGIWSVESWPPQTPFGGRDACRLGIPPFL
jgi:predicted amino acid-binding ACT domain protein